MREGVALPVPFLVADLLVAARERDGLERHETHLVAVLQGELHDRPDLIVVHRLDDRDDQADVDARGVEIFDRAQLHVEQVPDLAVRVGRLGHAVELQIRDSQACVVGLLREVWVLREPDAVGRGLHAEVADLARVPDRVEEQRRDRRLAARELHRHLASRLDADGVVEQLLDLRHRQLVDVAHLIGVHEARIAHHVAAVRQIDGQHRAASVLDGRRPVVVQRLGDGGKIAPRKQRFETAEKCGIDRQCIDEAAMNRAAFLNQHLAVAFDDVRFDFSDVFVDERFHAPAARQNGLARFTHAGRTQRIRRARPTQLW